MSNITREDIESFGYEHKNWHAPNKKIMWFRKPTNIDESIFWWIGWGCYEKDKTGVMIIRATSPKDYFHGDRSILNTPFFNGFIKNKSDLKQILQLTGLLK